MKQHLKGSLAVCALVAGTLGGAGAALAQEFTIRLAHHYPDTHIQAGGLETFVEEVESNSDGRIEVDVYPAETLVSGREALEAVEGGVVDAAPMPGNYQTGSIPELEYFTYPFMFEDAEHFRRAVNGGIHEMLVPLYEERNILLANYYHKGALHIFHNSDFLTTPEDYEGQRIRSLGSAISGLLEALGANPLSVSLGEVEASIERGVIDGLTSNCAAHLSRGWVEGLPYVTFLDMSQGGEGLGINLDFYNSLPEDLQQVVMEAAQTMQEQEWSEMIQEDEVACFDRWEEAGAEVQRLTDEERAELASYAQPTLEEAAANNPEIQRILDIAEETR